VHNDVDEQLLGSINDFLGGDVSVWKKDNMGPAAEGINLDEKITAIDLAEMRMDLLKGPRSWLVRLKRLRWE
jgi:hypothetical protein